MSCVRFLKRNNLVIDKYRLSNGEYIGSYELLNREDFMPVKILKLNDKIMWVLYEDMHIIKYYMK